MRTYTITATAAPFDDGSETWIITEYLDDTGNGTELGEFPTVGEACEFALMRGFGPIQIDLM